MDTSQIEIDFLEAKKQAESLENEANRIDQLANDAVQDALEEMMRFWKGESASAFYAKAVRIKEQMHQTARRLRCAAEQIHDKAEQIYRAEMEAARIAQQLEYGGSSESR